MHFVSNFINITVLQHCFSNQIPCKAQLFTPKDDTLLVLLHRSKTHPFLEIAISINKKRKKKKKRRKQKRKALYATIMKSV